MAVREKRILLTEDKDFGRWVYADKRASGGVVFLRYPSAARSTMPAAVVRLVERYDKKLFGCFVTVQPGRVRMGRRTRSSKHGDIVQSSCFADLVGLGSVRV